MSVCVHPLSAFTAKSFPSTAPRPSAPWLCHARKTGPLQWAPPRGVPLSVLGQFWRGNRIPFGYTLPFRKHPSPHLFPRVPMHTVEKLWTISGCEAGTGRWGSVKGVSGSQVGLALTSLVIKGTGGGRARTRNVLVKLTWQWWCQMKGLNTRFKLKEQKGIFVDNHPDISSISCIYLWFLK